MHWAPGDAAEIVREEGHRLVDSCDAARSAPVAACPGWTATDLAVHMAVVHRRVADLCATRATQAPSTPGPFAPAHDPWGWCREAVELVAEALAGIDTDEPVWSWTDRQDGGFYHRRMLHETTLHRWDAQLANDAVGSVDAVLAADGVDELMSVGMRFRSAGISIDYPAGSIALMTTDTGHRWSLAAVDGALGVGRDDAVITGTDATMTAEATALLMRLWGRDGGPVVVRGDHATAEAWCAVAP